MNEKINDQMTVNELLSRWPGAIPVFLKHKMACVGCTMAAYDTLEDVAATYHLKPQEFFTELDQLIRKIDGQPQSS